MTYFTLPSIRKEQVVTTEGNDSTEIAEVKGHEDQPLVNFVSFCENPSPVGPALPRRPNKAKTATPPNSTLPSTPISFSPLVEDAVHENFCSKSLFLAGALLFFGLATSVQAQFTYTINNGTITITGYTGTNSVLTIPSTIDDLPVTDIGTNAFAYCHNLTSVTIPESVTSIGYIAFYQCVGLTNITIDNGVTSIGAGAFAQCSVTNVTIPNSVTSIGGGAFEQCPLTNVTIGDGVTSIGPYAFNNCPLSAAYFLGNAPHADSSVFVWILDGPEEAVSAYYLPGTTGWAEFTTNTGVPTALWTLPYPLLLNGSSGVQANQFGFTISWATNVPVVVEASTDLSNPVWTPIATNVLNTNGTSLFSDPNWAIYPARFYRLRPQ